MSETASDALAGGYAYTDSVASWHWVFITGLDLLPAGETGIYCVNGIALPAPSSGR